MDLKTIIIEGKISKLEQLTKAGQREVATDPHLQLLIEENAALMEVSEDLPPTPQWDHLRYGVIARAEDILTEQKEEQRIEQLPIIHRMNVLKPWLAQAMAACALIAIICVLAYMIPSGEEPGTETVQVSRQSVQWYNYALASRGGQSTDDNSRQVNHP